MWISEDGYGDLYTIPRLYREMLDLDNITHVATLIVYLLLSTRHFKPA